MISTCSQRLAHVRTGLYDPAYVERQRIARFNNNMLLVDTVAISLETH